MSEKSYFHEYFEQHKDQLMDEYKIIGRKSFCEKYKIGYSLSHDYIFWARKTKEQEDFRSKKKELSEKFRVSERYIQGLVNKGFALREIEQGRLVKWEIICKEIIKMDKPGDILESMYVCM